MRAVGATRDDLADVFLAWGGYAYGTGLAEGEARAGARRSDSRRSMPWSAQPGQPRARPPRLRRLLPIRGRARGGGAEPCGGARRGFGMSTTSRPEAPRRAARRRDRAGGARPGDESEMDRRADAPWLSGAYSRWRATVDYLFAFAAPDRRWSRDHHFDQLFAAYLGR